MILKATHRGITAIIVKDRSDIGWYLYISSPSGESRDHLQDAKEIVISQDEEDYNIPSSAWKITEDQVITSDPRSSTH